MKTITFYFIHKIISQTSIFLFALYLIPKILLKFDVVDNYQDERMKGAIVTLIGLYLLYTVVIFYTISLYPYLIISYHIFKDKSQKKQNIINLTSYFLVLAGLIIVAVMS